jgi:hypothetical protein
MTEKMISRRCAVSLFGLAAALGFAVPTTMLTTSDAEAQAQPSAPATPAPATPLQDQPLQQRPAQQRSAWNVVTRRMPVFRNDLRRGGPPSRSDARRSAPLARGVRRDAAIVFT